ncbi:serine/threonine-protein kinase RsbT [Prauserella shujinwangii]|uniref:Serine/threonine-protein kinase RsbT n=1 Tax=Prauserella shujinwangii TaxID=1453103 RepID=A0A2T0M001_9PSEU|nr:anti-sigma regulatory factor [Prauserella shujinwangii]PRX49925.1 serine/threonine-protein kinase RsbT [Prauserella shujinwangii]
MTIVPTVREVPIRTDMDIVGVRQAVREVAVSVGFSLVDQTKVVTAASELARNTLKHGGGGTAEIELEERADSTALRLVFRDEGPGIGDVELALRDGYSSSGGLGLGLSGARRLADEFDLRTAEGEGTTVTVAFVNRDPAAR